jgi:hypothetical protein
MLDVSLFDSLEEVTLLSRIGLCFENRWGKIIGKVGNSMMVGWDFCYVVAFCF